MKTIPKDETTRHQAFDQTGYIFRWRGNLYRAIYPDSEPQIRGLFTSGLINDLVEQGLFPPTKITDHRTEDCSLVLWHHTIPNVSLPPEWSFSMLKDAALALLQVNLIAQGYGYQTADAHGFNIVFDRGRPVYVDIGSFRPILNEFICRNPGWRDYGGFMRSFYAPLKLWSNGHSYVARQALHGEQMPMAAFWTIRWSFLRLVPTKLLRLFEYIYYKYKALNTLTLVEFSQLASGTAGKERVAAILLKLSRWRLLWFSSVNLYRLRKRVERIKPPRIPTTWGSYHEFTDLSARHEHLLALLERLGVKTVLDMAGNAGFLSRRIAQLRSVEHVICVDYDENAIDTLHVSLRHDPANISTALLNFSLFLNDTKFPYPPERFRSDAVLALALSHHLLLGQGLTLDFIFARLKTFSRRYVAIEYMPMGLYSSLHDKIPVIPQWYTLDWFRRGFDRHFECIEETVLDKNRILFVGEIRDST